MIGLRECLSSERMWPVSGFVRCAAEALGSGVCVLLRRHRV